MRKKKTLALLFLLVILTLAASGGATLYGVYLWASKDLPEFKSITDYSPRLVTTIHARDGQVLGYLYREKRFLVGLDELPDYLPRAFLAVEDSSFYEHEGIDPTAILRASLENLRAGAIVQGGSTLNQQVVKQLLLSSERKFTRKIKEAILAYRLERRLSKKEILTIYLNQVFFGANAYGVEAASRTFFGKRAKDVSLAEAALLAGLPKAPSAYNPYHAPEQAKTRQAHVLGRLLDMRWITRTQYDQALAEPLEYRTMPEPSWGLGAYYMEEVRRELIELLSEDNMQRLGIKLDRYDEDAVYESGLHVYTAMEPFHQAAAERSLRKALEDASKRRGWLGPIKRLKPEAFRAFLSDESATDETPAPGQWVKALVVGQRAGGLDVRFSSHSGVIGASSLFFCRGAQPVAGDVVWASITSRAEKKPDPAVAFLKEGEFLLALEQKPDVQGGMVSFEPPTGDVVAVVGGYDFSDSQFNRATQARRQCGSAFKPIVYSAAMDHGFTPASVVDDSPISFGNWAPRNYGGGFSGPVLLSVALARSINVVAVRLTSSMGIRAVIKRAKDLGLEADFPPVMPVCLGAEAVTPINLCQAYSAFARDGSYVKPRFILSVNNAWGQPILSMPTQSVRAVSPQNAYTIASMLKEVVTSGTGYAARVLNRPLAGKTGTTNEEMDAWFIGFSPYLLTGAYIGFDQLRPMGHGETGGVAALPAWLGYRKVVEEKYPVQDFRAPGQEEPLLIVLDQNKTLPEDNEALPFQAVAHQVQESVRRTENASPDQETRKEVF